MRIKNLGLAVLLAALMAGCSSGVKLDNVPVEDKAGAAVATTAGDGASSGSAGSGGVAGVQVERAPSDEKGPAATAHVVYFDFDSYVVRPEFQPVIEAHARYLRADPKRHVVLEGHTDERGGREYNLALGQKRAEAVSRALTLLGVGSAQIEAVSFGKEKPAVDGHDEAAWAKNRRVEIKYR